MCGIAGVLHDDRGAARRMLDAMAHRGPDGWQVWTDSGCTLGHRRLAIVDVAGGAQPMTSTDGRFTIVFNGQVYNHGALREELTALGSRFATVSDTEVVVEAFRHWGTAAFSRLEGMFALALHDRDAPGLVLARDDWGIKPLYWSADARQGFFAFASEIKGLLALPQVGRRLDPAAIAQRAALEFILDDATPFAHIRSFPPGQVWRVCAGLAPERLEAIGLHGDPSPSGPSDPEALARDLAEAIVHSVHQQLQGERSISAIVSGGLDSTLVAHALCKEGLEMPLFSVSDDEANPDLVAARRFAQAVGADHRVRIVGTQDVWRDLPRLLAAHEGFHYAEAFFLPLFAEVARHGPVAFCGQGADELWGGYDRYRDPIATLAGRRAALECFADPRALAGLEAMHAAHRDPAILAKWEQGAQLADFQLRLVDGTSMAAGVEVRVPFLDTRIQALSDTAPWALKVRDGIEKWALRQAARRLGLPEEFASRPKVPAGRSTLRGAIEGIEREAANLVPSEAAAPFIRPMERLAFRAWEEVFVQRGGDPGNLRLEDVAA